VCVFLFFYSPVLRAARRAGAASRTVHLAHRQIFPQEIEALLDRAGFAIEEHSGDFRGADLEPGVESQIVVARRS
jgi:hypothetical protein